MQMFRRTKIVENEEWNFRKTHETDNGRKLAFKIFIGELKGKSYWLKRKVHTIILGWVSRYLEW